MKKKDQQTPLHIAAAQGHEHIIEYLLSKGAKQDLREKVRFLKIESRY